MPADYSEHHEMSSDLLTSSPREVVTLPQRENVFPSGEGYGYFLCGQKWCIAYGK